MTYLNFNGSILPAGTPIIGADNRGFRYGEGLFETMRVQDHRLPLAQFHFDRLFSGARLLGFDLSGIPSPEELAAAALALCEKNGHGAHARVRLTLFPAEMARPNDPGSQVPLFVIQSYPLPSKEVGSSGTEPEKPLVIDLFPDGRKSCDIFSNLKSNNYLLYSQAALYAPHHGFDDCLVLNTHDRIADSSISNLFYCREGRIFTPSLAEGCVAGVMRRFLLGILPGAGFDLVETPVTPDDLGRADEAFLTNAVRGIRIVGRFRGKSYGHQLTGAVKAVLRKHLPFHP